MFIHGALCYSYSGLCLFSAQTLGRSGNRGKCAYSCRDSYEVADAPLTLRDGSPVQRDPAPGFPFSMKDLALPDHLPALRAAGVSCFKIEGRKKSPLYVATTTDYYRKLLDGTLDAGRSRRSSRPTCRRCSAGRGRGCSCNRTRTRRSPTATPSAIAARRSATCKQSCVPEPGAALAFPHAPAAATTRRLADRPAGPGQAVRLRGRAALAGRRRRQAREVFEAPAGDARRGRRCRASIRRLPRGAPVYCSSSQAVKQKYRHDRPKPGLWHGRQAAAHRRDVLTDGELTRTRAASTTSEAIAATLATVPFAVRATTPAGHGADAVRSCFARLGQSRFALAVAHVDQSGRRLRAGVAA